MKTKTIDDLFQDGLRDIYYAERQILKALPKMIRATKSTELRGAFEKHLDQTQGQVERLQEAFELLGRRAQGKTCPAIDGILEEGQEIMEEFKDSPAMDAGLLAAAQAVEHYEITRYGTLCTWAKMLGKNDIAALLKQTLAEEEDTDKTLSKLAEASVNRSAMEAAA